MIQFRPHHFLCTLGFEGKGYSPDFVKNFGEIADALRAAPEGDEIKIEVTAGTDSICAPCPNRRGKSCATEGKISELDRGHAKALGLKAGDTVTWGEAKARIAARLTPEKFQKICAPCSWRALGVCEAALRKEIKKGHRIPRFLSLSVSVLVATLLGMHAISSLASDKPAASLKRSWDFYLVGKCPEARKSLTAAKKDPTLGDDVLMLDAKCARHEAEMALSKKSPATVISQSKNAIHALEDLRRRFLYSPWQSKVAEEIGQNEIIQGMGYDQQRKSLLAREHLENGFQGLLLENAFFHVDSKVIDTYARGCKSKMTDLCTPWLIRISSLFAKASLENRTLAKIFPEVVSQAKPNFATGKITLPYKQKDADDLAYEAALAVALKDDADASRKMWEQFLTTYPRSTLRMRARFWLAKALEKKGDVAATKPLYEQIVKEAPLTLQGLLAFWALGKSPDSRFDSAEPATDDSDRFLTPTEAVRLKRAERMLDADAPELARLDLKDLKPHDTETAGFLMRLAELDGEAGAYSASFSILGELIQRQDERVYTHAGLDLVFPVVDFEVIGKNAKAEGLDPILVMSLIKQESAFDSEVHSGSGASGYMQLMPFTASEVEPDVERKALLEVDTNVRVGTKYLKKLIAKYNGNIAEALAAYNAGPNAVDRWLREGRGEKGMFEFIEQIPYKETQNYVGSIFRNYAWYKNRLENTQVGNFDNFWPKALVAGPTPAATSGP